MKRCYTTIWLIIILLIYHYGKLLPLVSEQISRIKIMYHFSHLLVSTSNKYKTVFNPSLSLSELLSDLKWDFKKFVYEERSHQENNPCFLKFILLTLTEYNDFNFIDIYNQSNTAVLYRSVANLIRAIQCL